LTEALELGIRNEELGIKDRETAGRLFAAGVKIVIIKHGKKGSTAYLSGGKSYTVKPFPVKALKSFGGGDGYGSAFIYGLLEGLSIPKCLEMASASASMLVSAHGCSEFMPKVKDITDFIKKAKENGGVFVS
jgi:5-dehydro-2-deoxygluconokinase